VNMSLQERCLLEALFLASGPIGGLNKEMSLLLSLLASGPESQIGG
jgi:hypothetical protein